MGWAEGAGIIRFQCFLLMAAVWEDSDMHHQLKGGHRLQQMAPSLHTGWGSTQGMEK